MARFRWGAHTDTGQVRPMNEDSLHAGDELFVVADGMGGHLAGEVASAMAIDVVRDAVAEDTRDVPALVQAIVRANNEIFESARVDIERRGMGTTLTALTALPADAAPELAGDGTDAVLGLANVGDSRTYLLRSGRLRQVTVDHSYVQELVATGQITEAEARYHPHRNIVTRALGVEPDVRVDAWTLPMVKGDRFLLCSDGLVDEVSDEAIAAVLGSIADPQRAAEELVATANRHGGRDNVTVIVVDVLEGADAPDDASGEIPWTDPELAAPRWADDTGSGGIARPLPVGAAVTRTEPDAAARADAPAAADTAVASGPRGRQRWAVPAIGGGVLAALVVAVLVALAGGDDAPTPPTTVATTVASTVPGATTTARVTTTVATTTTTPRTTTRAATTTATPTTSAPGDG
jgi:protein phosphatase